MGKYLFSALVLFVAISADPSPLKFTAIAFAILCAVLFIGTFTGSRKDRKKDSEK